MMLSSQNKALQVSLRCLTHPLSLAMVGLLLLNDRLLKWQFASWWTGKLSDVAGLFFFPFVLTTVISLFWRRRAVGAMAIFTVGWLFALIKVIPAVNALAIQLWSALLAAPVTIVLDPTDLLALPVLGLAGLLWRREWDRPVSAKPSPLFPYLAALTWSVALLASLASSCEEDPGVYRFTYFNDHYYVSGRHDLVYARFAPAESVWETFYAPFPPELEQPAGDTQDEVCLSDQDTICYRLGDQASVEISEDGRRSWQLAWQYPPERMRFLKRHVGCGVPDSQLYDIAVVPSGNSSGHYVLVAAGNQGVIVKDLENNWQRVGVVEAEPRPLAATSLGQAIIATFGELALSVLVAFGTAVGLLVSFWRDQHGAKLLWLTITIFLLTVAYVGYLVFDSSNLVGLIFLVPGYALFVITSYAMLRYLGRTITGSGQDSRAANAWLATTLGNHLLPAGAFILWAAGAIPHYEVALVLALLTYIGITWWGQRQIGAAVNGVWPDRQQKPTSLKG